MSLASSASTTTVNATQWFIPRIINSFMDAVDQQALEYLENVESIKNGTFTGKELEFPTFIRVLQNLNYFISPYAAACMIMAIILNRTLAFASTSTNFNINRFNNAFKKILRVLTIGLLLNVLNDVIRVFAINYDSFNEIISQFVIIDRNQVIPIAPLLWKVFISFCISNFIETLIAVNSGQLPFYDTALTLFEHSLAFQESRYSRVPSCQLLIILISSIVNQIVVQLFGLFNLKKYQLIPSTIFGLNLIGICLFNFFNKKLSKIPIILILSIIPQIIVISMSMICLLIYSLAVLINGTTQGLTYTPMINNLSESLNLQLNEDFNSLVTRFGIIMFNALDNDEYVNEYPALNFQLDTYLDNEDEKRSYLLSSYFNKIDETSDSKNKKQKSNESISSIWSFIKRYISFFNLIKVLFRFIFKFLFKKSKSQQQQPTDTQASILIDLDDQEFEINPNDTITIVDQIPKFLEMLEDDTDDFHYESESELDPLEYDSDILSDDEETSLRKTYISSLSEQRMHDSNPSSVFSTSLQTTNSSKPKPIEELFQTNDILSIINPSKFDDVSYLRYIRAHLSNDSRLTRSSFSQMNEDDLLNDLILEKRQHNNNNTHDLQDLDEFEKLEHMECVVCQTNPRNIIIWPCKCFAICESCRLSLGVRGFSHCVCCRRKVDGFSKVFLP